MIDGNPFARHAAACSEVIVPVLFRKALLTLCEVAYFFVIGTKQGCY